jgi:ADP-ribose pyrophosphatase YjhB (NUDIX family)
VLPGGVEADEGLETALTRELREELAATADVRSLLYVLERGDERQYFYLARVRAWSADASDRDGPEFTDPARGEYHLPAIPPAARALAAIDLKRGPSPNSSSATCAPARTCSAFLTFAPAWLESPEPAAPIPVNAIRPACQLRHMIKIRRG